MAELIWSNRSLGHLDEICDYIGETSDAQAKAFASRIFKVAESLKRLPLSGWVVEKYNDPEIRETLSGKHRVVYRYRDDTVEILMIVRGARMLPDSPD